MSTRMQLAIIFIFATIAVFVADINTEPKGLVFIDEPFAMESASDGKAD